MIHNTRSSEETLESTGSSLENTRRERREDLPQLARAPEDLESRAAKIITDVHQGEHPIDAEDLSSSEDTDEPYNSCIIIQFTS